jgi:hypothetical protein
VHNVITGLFLLYGFFVVLLVRSVGDYSFPGMSIYRQEERYRVDSDRGWKLFLITVSLINIGVFNDFVSLFHFVCDRVCSHTQRECQRYRLLFSFTLLWFVVRSYPFRCSLLLLFRGCIMSISILQCNPSGGYYLPLCGVCSLFLRGEFPYLKGDEEHALKLVYCLDELESHWGEMSSIDQAGGVCFFHKTCALCMESGAVVVAVVEFDKEVTQ